MKKTFTLILCLSIVSFSQAQKIELALNLEEGKTYTQFSESSISIVQNINGQEVNIGMNVKGSMSYLVKTATKEDYFIEMKYDSLSMFMELPQGGSVEFSSEKSGENDIMSTILNGLTKKPFSLEMGRNGTIKEVNDLDTIWTSVFSQFSNVPEEQLNQLKDQIKNSYGSEALKGNIEMVTAIFPENRVKTGDEWVVNSSMKSAISVDVNTTYKLAEIQEAYYLITGNSMLTTSDTAAIVDSNGMPLKYNLSGTISSDIKIDKQSGWIIEAHNNQDIAGEVQVQANPKMPMTMTIPMTMKNETVIKGN